MSEILIKEYRGNTVENIHRGNIAIVTSSGDTAAYLGDIEKQTFMRSASKPIQVLPTLLAGLHTKFGLTTDEVAMLNSSHWGSSHHIFALENIAGKTGISPDDMIMLPCASTSASALAKKLTDQSRLHPREGKSRLQHCCSGKHFSLMMLQRELTGSTIGYERPDSPVQKQILGFISMLSQTPTYKIGLGTDGCGVPVFALPLRSIAMSYARLVDPFSLSNELRETIDYNFSCIHEHPEKINDYGTPSYYVNSNPDLIMKDGSRGVICMAIRSMKLGIAVKLEDGWTDEFQGLILANILEQLHYDDTGLIQKLKDCYSSKLYNDCGIEVGHSEVDFALDIDDNVLSGKYLTNDDYIPENDSAFAVSEEYAYDDDTEANDSGAENSDADTENTDSCTEEDEAAEVLYAFNRRVASAADRVARAAEEADDESIIDGILAENEKQAAATELSPDEQKSLRNRKSILGMNVVKPSTHKTFISNPLTDPISVTPSTSGSNPDNTGNKPTANNTATHKSTDEIPDAASPDVTSPNVTSPDVTSSDVTSSDITNLDVARHTLFARDIKPANIISQKKREE